MSPAVQFAALSDGTRCALVELLGERPRPVNELASAFSISRPAVSRHLRVLREAGLLEEERRGREIVYALKRQRLRALGAWLEQHWTDRLSRLKQIAEASAPTPQLELDL